MKEGDTVEYYAPGSVVGDHFNICKGTVSTIFPRDSLQVMPDVHVYVDGMIPITYGQPIRLVRGEWFNSDNFNCNFIVGDDNGANLHRILGRFSDIKKRAMEEFIESNKSRKTVNATVHFIILLSFNWSFHIYSLIVSLFERPCGKRRDPPKVSSPKAQKLRKKKKDELSDPPYLPPEESRKMRSKDKSNRKNPPEEMCLEGDVAGAVNVAKSVQAGAGKVDESVHAVGVSFS